MSFDRYLARQFGGPAGLGGLLVASVMNRQNRPLYEAALGLLAADGSDSVLDVGCGNGFVLALLAGRTGASLAGVDPSKGMVRAAARRNRGAVAAGRLVVREGDSARLPFPDGSFAKACSVNTVYFWPDVDAATAEIRRVLRPGGVFVNALYANERLAARSHTRTGYRFHDPEALVAAARAAGFEAERVPVLDGIGYCVVSHAP